MKKILIGLLLATNIVTMVGCTKAKVVDKGAEVVEEAKEKAETKVPKYKVTLEDGTKVRLIKNKNNIIEEIKQKERCEKHRSFLY